MPALASLAGLGGIWNAEVVPVSRTAWPAVVSLVLVLGVCVLGAVVWHRSATPGSRSALVLAGVVGLVVAAAGAVTPDLVQWLVSHVPGAGLFRDGSRFIALLAPVQALLFGLGAARLVAAVRLPALGTTLATALVLAPVALMPDAAWGLSGHLRAVDYPDELAVARAAVEHDREVGRNGDLLSLPFTSYRRPEWNHGRRTLDPVGRYFPVDYLASDTLVVSGQVVPGEDARATRVEHDLGDVVGARADRSPPRRGDRLDPRRPRRCRLRGRRVRHRSARARRRHRGAQWPPLLAVAARRRSAEQHAGGWACRRPREGAPGPCVGGSGRCRACCRVATAGRARRLADK